MRSIVYHPQLVAVYHQAAGGYTLARDEIHGVAVMISSPTGADDIPLLSQWIKKSDKSEPVGFFGRADKKDIFKSFRMDLNPCAL